MALIPYLAGGESILAAHMNSLTEELDRKKSLALDNHSILYLLGENPDVTRADFAPYLGPTFFFGDGPQPITGYWGTWSYDHEEFQRAVAGAVVWTPGGGQSAYSTTQKWVRVEPFPISYWTTQGRTKLTDRALLSRSLEAHRLMFTAPGADPELYWVGETFTIPPTADTTGLGPYSLERIRSYEQAEILMEGTVNAVVFKPHLNKYNFFRFHNCTGGAVTVRFENATGDLLHGLTVPARGSKCVRRTAAEGTYTDGFNHFQRFLAGDPRWYQHGVANIVTNPSLVIPFVNDVLAGRPLDSAQRQFARPTVLLDPHIRPSLPSGYSTLYGDTTQDTTKLGDVLHHKGQFIDVRTDPSTGEVTSTRLSFNGYGALLTLVPEILTRESGDDLQIKTAESGVTHDFICLSTNLFCTGAGQFIQYPVKNATDWITLDRHMPEATLAAVDATTTTQSLTYATVLPGGTAGPNVTQTITRTSLVLHSPGLTGPTPPAATPTLKQTDTMVEVKAMKGLTGADYPDPNNAYSTYSNTVQLTPGGFVLLTTQTIPLAAPIATLVTDIYGTSGFDPENRLAYYLAQPVLDPFLMGWGNYVTTDGTTLTVKRAIVFTGYGFPDVDSWTYTGFLTPRIVRAYSDRPVGHDGTLPASGAHPDFTEGQIAVNGQEIAYNTSRGFVETEIKLCSPWNGANDSRLRDVTDYGRSQVVGTMSNNDVVFGAVRNHATAGYWAANRTRCHANRIYYASTDVETDLDGACWPHVEGTQDAADMKRFWRMEMAVEHYNNLAAKVNSIARIKPLNWEDHGVIQNGNSQAERYRLRSNAFGIYDKIITLDWFNSQSTTARAAYLIRNQQWAGLRPSNQYCAATFSASDPLMLAASYASIPVSNVAQFPDNFALLKATSSRQLQSVTVTGQLELNTTGTVLAIRRGTGYFTSASYLPDFAPAFVGEVTGAPSTFLDGAAVRSDLNALTDYKWLRNEDVKAYATTNGWKFMFRECGTGLALEQFDVTEFDFQTSAAVFAPSLHQRYLWDPTGGTDFGPDPLPPVIPSPKPINTTAAAAMHIRFLEFVPSETPTWITGTSAVAMQSQAMDWADQVVKQVGSITIAIQVPAIPYTTTNSWYQGGQSQTCVGLTLTPTIPERFRRVAWDAILATARNPADYTTDLICREPLQVTDADGIADNSRVIEIDIPWFEFTPDFSLTSADAAKARATYGTGVLPFTAQTTGAKRVLLWRDFSSAA